MNKENLSKLWDISKKIINYAFLLIVLSSGFYIGRMYEIYFTEDDSSKSKDLKDISVAIDENNRIFIIDKETEEYQVYSDSIGITIFKMYANRIYNTQPSQ
jgi:hypothetical protein